jgi:osmotically inducible protein OsmC
VWTGDLKSGHGTMNIGRAQTAAPYSFGSRFEAGDGYNPEELIAAAHAGCFSMALANKLAAAGFRPARIKTTANVKLEKKAEGFAITAIELDAEGEVEGVDDGRFSEFVNDAKANCPVSKALSSVPITAKSRLLAKSK